MITTKNYLGQLLTCPKCGGGYVSRHVEALPSEPYHPIREEGYQCEERACRHLEACMNTADDASYEAFRNRWNDPIQVWTPQQWQDHMAEKQRLYEERDREWAWPFEGASNTSPEYRANERAEREATERRLLVWRDQRDDEQAAECGPLPINRELHRLVVAAPDDDEPRREYARWLRTQDHILAKPAASYIEAALERAELLAADPKRVFPNVSDEELATVYGREQEPRDPGWWWACKRDVSEMLCDYTQEFKVADLVDDPMNFRGFTEHVAMRASTFLDLAEELYSLVPIRHLTLTYCKGRDHTDHDLWKRLLDSPHLDQIRTLRFWKRVDGDNQYTELNRFTDEDIELLARSKHLRKLTYLEFRDQSRLTICAFDALARSPNLPLLSYVGHDMYRYDYPVQSTWGGLGKLQRQLGDRPLARYAAELEARHGQLPWLHPVELYGTESPEFERVVAHPVGK